MTGLSLDDLIAKYGEAERAVGALPPVDQRLPDRVQARMDAHNREVTGRRDDLRVEISEQMRRINELNDTASNQLDEYGDTQRSAAYVAAHRAHLDIRAALGVSE